MDKSMLFQVEDFPLAAGCFETGKSMTAQHDLFVMCEGGGNVPPL